MIIESGTRGLGWCTWYSGMRGTPRRRLLPANRCRTTGGNGATGKILVATTTSSRSWPSASPRIRSLRPKPYTSAVSKKVTPSSRARRTISRAPRSAYASP